MRKTVIGATVLSAALATSFFATAQKRVTGLDVPVVTPGPGWKACPRCVNQAHIDDDRAKAEVDTRQFDKHDISGVWGDNGVELDVKSVPPFTPEGQKMFDATLTNVPGVNAKDPMNICDPLGFPRAFAYNYGMEFIQLKDRTLQFFEFEHTYRTIWTDGRKLPDDPPLDRYLGYSVGHWEGDVFKVESSHFDTRSWLSEDRRKRVHGFAHSDQLKTIEEYKRINYGKLDMKLTIIDPKVFTKPWVTEAIETLRPGNELSEYFCVPSEETQFNSFSTLPTASGSKATGLGPDAK